MTTKTGLTLTMERTFDAPIERVYQALTGKEHIARWYGPSSDFTVDVQTWEPREGGSYRVALRHEDGTVHTVHGEFLELVENESVVYSWSWAEQPPMDSQVTFVLREKGGKTLLSFTHAGLPDAESRDAHEGGWTGALERLAAEVG